MHLVPQEALSLVTFGPCTLSRLLRCSRALPRLFHATFGPFGPESPVFDLLPGTLGGGAGLIGLRTKGLRLIADGVGHGEFKRPSLPVRPFALGF